MKHQQRRGGQQELFSPAAPIQLSPQLRRAVLPALAELIAAVLRRPGAPRAEGGQREEH